LLRGFIDEGLLPLYKSISQLWFRLVAMALAATVLPFASAQAKVSPRAYASLPGQVQRGTHDDQRNGTTSLFAALDLKTSRPIGQRRHRHCSVEFLRLPDLIEDRVPGGLDIDIVVNNYGTHNTAIIHAYVAIADALCGLSEKTAAASGGAIEGQSGVGLSVNPATDANVMLLPQGPIDTWQRAAL
jgi:hypothetical protein